jgi:hypothetical protein
VQQTLKTLVAEHYPEVAAELVEPLLRLLHVARVYCGGDIDKFLVMMVVGLRTTQHPDFRERTPQQLAGAEAGVLPSLGVNGQSIADSLGIPKETVRRKIHELIGQGWIARRGGHLYFTTQAYLELAPIRDEMAALAASYHDVVDTLAQRA